MKITRVECFILDKQFPFVRVHTDEGITGIGEIFRRNAPIHKTAVESVLAPNLIGKDPLNTEARWQEMSRAGVAIDTRSALYCAMAGVDIALWDIRGKTWGVPIYQLLGGKVRDQIPVYASSLARTLTPLEEAKRAAQFAEQGFRGYKLHNAVAAALDDPRETVVANVREVRRAVGDGYPILVDVNGAFSAHRAIEIGKELEDLGTFHFEEPCPNYDLKGLAQVAGALAMPIASGECIYTRQDFADLILEGQVDIVQPDIVKAGGFTEMQKIAAVASTFRRPITVHNIQPTICTVAHLHFCANQENAVYSQEYVIEEVSIRDQKPILKTPLEVKDGYMTVPDGPGLGVEIDEDAFSYWAAM